ncbi:hypothetical protein [Flavicella sediminum]|uniref:hypothetical protein n=1 Tax=Flavicella sediminum TaxID=2585141 RepID=UPI001120EEAF|nr:hypothetical protein [Flavicella sediminum]
MEKISTVRSESYLLRINLAIDAFLKVEDSHRNLLEIIYWWEKRRVAFNAIFISFGLINMSLSRFFLGLTLQESLYSTFTLASAILVINVAYSLSCVSEFFVRKDNKYAAQLFKRGLLFCVLASMLPTLLHAKDWFLSIS